jgi:hypothetical protein
MAVLGGAWNAFLAEAPAAITRITAAVCAALCAYELTKLLKSNHTEVIPYAFG